MNSEVHHTLQKKLPCLSTRARAYAYVQVILDILIHLSASVRSFVCVSVSVSVCSWYHFSCTKNVHYKTYNDMKICTHSYTHTKPSLKSFSRSKQFSSRVYSGFICYVFFLSFVCIAKMANKKCINCTSHSILRGMQMVCVV